MDWKQRPTQKQKKSPHEDDEAADGTIREENPEASPSKEPTDLDPMVLEPPRILRGIEVEIRGESKTVMDWKQRPRKAEKKPS